MAATLTEGSLPSLSFVGTVTAVSSRPVGTSLTADTAAGATTITVADNASITGGDQLQLTDPESGDTETVLVDDVDDTSTVTLATPTVNAFQASSTVAQLPAALEVVAFISVEDDSEPIPVVVEHALGAALLQGIRDRGVGELVRVDRVDAELRVVDVLGRSTMVDADSVMISNDSGNGSAMPLPTQLAEIYETANGAAEAAADAGELATVAQETATGKNTVTYSNDLPGSAPNAAGDVWFQRDGTPAGGIVAQFEGLGGTDWAARQLRNEAIANLDAGKLTAGTAFVNALQVLTNFTLGSATENGVIQSYDFAGSLTGVLLDKDGLTAKGGTLAGSIIVGSVISGGTVSVGTPGGVEIYSSVAVNPFQSGQTWATTEYRIGAAGWNPGLSWAAYLANDSYVSNLATGQLKLSSPWRDVNGIESSAVMQLLSASDGRTIARFDAATVTLVSNTMRFESRNSSAFDVTVINTDLLQFKRAGGERFGVNLAASGTGFGALALSSRAADNSLRQMVVAGSTVVVQTSARDLIVGENFSFPESPSILDDVAEVGISFRNLGQGGTLDVIGPFGNDFKYVRAFAFQAQSDLVWKAEVQDAPAGMLQQVEALRPVEYGVKHFDPTTRRTRGLIAQEVRDVVPAAVTGDDGELGVDLYVLLATVIGAIQELAAEVHATPNDSPEALP